MDWLADHFEWVKAGHVISVIAWMAGMLYLPRLFVYHAATSPGSDASETFKVMELKLLRVIMLPAMLAAFAFGILMVYLLGMEYFRISYWLHAKILLVLVMAAAHMRLSWHRKRFAMDANAHSEKYFRLLNELPAILMALIVILVVVKPF